jgi:hypothetical protein
VTQKASITELVVGTGGIIHYARTLRRIARSSTFASSGALKLTLGIRTGLQFVAVTAPEAIVSPHRSNKTRLRVSASRASSTASRIESR